MSCTCPCHKCPYCDGTGRLAPQPWSYPWSNPGYPWKYWHNTIGTTTTTTWTAHNEYKQPEPPQEPGCTCK